MIVTNFFEALQAGKELANAATWKKAQLVTAKLTILGGLLLGMARLIGLDHGISDTDLASIIAAVGVVVGLFNGAATAVSSTRAGVSKPPNRRTDRGGGGPPSGSAPVTASAPADVPPDLFHARSLG